MLATAACGVLAFGAAGSALADPTRFNLDSASELDTNGWQFRSDGDQSSFTGGLMQITTSTYAEWACGATHVPSPPTPAPAWWLYVTSERGWWVEARVKVLAAPPDSTRGIGMWIHDGKKLQTLVIGMDTVTLLLRTAHPYAFNTTNDFHVYRVQRPSADVLQLVIDGKKVLDFSTVGDDIDGSETLSFGDLGGVGSSSLWDYVAYDTAAPGTENNDDDKDGIPLSRDLCPKVKDDGKDSDFDNIGDACDPCPLDAYNDADGDGLCADVDVCPNSVENVDANQNGQCDANECSYGLPRGFAAVAAGTTGAQVCNVNGLICPCLDLACATSNGTCASGGSTGAGGSSSSGSAGGTAGTGAPGTAGRGGATAAGAGMPGSTTATGGAGSGGVGPGSSTGGGGAGGSTRGSTGGSSSGGASVGGTSGGTGGRANTGSSGGTSPSSSTGGAAGNTPPATGQAASGSAGGGCAVTPSSALSQLTSLGLLLWCYALLVRRGERRRRQDRAAVSAILARPSRPGDERRSNHK